MNEQTEEVEMLLDKYGLEQILEDAELSLVEVLIILDELHYINLEQYEEGRE